MGDITLRGLVDGVDDEFNSKQHDYEFSRNRKFYDGNALYTTVYTPTNALIISGEYVTINGEYVLLTE